MGASTKELLDKYYSGLASGGDWQSMLSDEILLTGTIAKESRGKEAFVNNNFFKMVRDLNVKQMIVENDNSCVMIHYDLVSPKGKSFTSVVAEIWNAKNGKLASLTIYFDTAKFQTALVLGNKEKKKSILEFSGTWKGDDADKVFAQVMKDRERSRSRDFEM